MSTRTATIIPTRGLPCLRQAVESALSHADVVVVTDSDENYANVLCTLDGIASDVTIVKLPYRCTGDGFCGHRVYAAFAHLLPHDVVTFLDEDNWYEPEHIPSLVAALGTRGRVAYSLRRIVSVDGEYICHDDCESLGPSIGVAGRYLVDTSCYAFRTEWLRRHASEWDFGWGADSRFWTHVAAHFEPVGTGRYTLNYRLGGNPNSVKREFFEQGNAIMRQKYAGGFPWAR